MPENDIYIKTDGDPNFNPNTIELFDDLEIMIQQIEVLLFTRRGDVLSEDKMGIDLESLIYTLNASKQNIETAITDQINTFVPLAAQYKVRVVIKFYRGTIRDIATINIYALDVLSTSIVLT